MIKMYEWPESSGVYIKEQLIEALANRFDWLDAQAIMPTLVSLVDAMNYAEFHYRCENGSVWSAADLAKQVTIKFAHEKWYHVQFRQMQDFLTEIDDYHEGVCTLEYNDRTQALRLNPGTPLAEEAEDTGGYTIVTVTHHGICDEVFMFLTDDPNHDTAVQNCRDSYEQSCDWGDEDQVDTHDHIRLQDPNNWSVVTRRREEEDEDA
jgi:hypothetical protein